MLILVMGAPLVLKTTLPMNAQSQKDSAGITVIMYGLMTTAAGVEKSGKEKYPKLSSHKDSLLE